MTTYRLLLNGKDFSSVQVEHNIVSSAGKNLSLVVGKQWEDVLSLFNMLGVEVRPEVEEHFSNAETLPIEMLHRGWRYFFHWRGNSLVRITATSPEGETQDLAWEQLPVAVQKALSL